MTTSQLINQIDQFGVDIQRLVTRLSELGYIFERPEDVLPGPEAEAAEAIARIETEIGLIPLAIKLFWLRVGSVDLSGFHPDWVGCDYPDPLIVFPPSYALYELDEFLEDRNERIAAGQPYVISVSPDFLHKANVSGGLPYSVSVPAEKDDPPLNCEWHQVSFMEYLHLALKFGGFPGLERTPEHTWPVLGINRVCI